METRCVFGYLMFFFQQGDSIAVLLLFFFAHKLNTCNKFLSLWKQCCLTLKLFIWRKGFNFSGDMRRMSSELVGWLHNLTFIAPIQYLNSIGFITVIYTVMTLTISGTLA